jgi:hypothetical protein
MRHDTPLQRALLLHHARTRYAKRIVYLARTSVVA